jgi:hypothetical protein
MGYRNYLGSLPKREYNKIKGFTLQELYEHKGEEWSEDDPYDCPGHVGVYDVAKETHYELGKYVDSFDTKFFKPVFKNKETQAHFIDEHDFYIVQPEFVLHVIEHYTKLVRDYYKRLLNDFYEDRKSKAEFMVSKDSPITEQEMSSIYAIISHVRDMALEWGVSSWFEESVPYDFNPENPKLVSSWKYEYEVFELVRIYKTFDWKRNVMIYYGY